MDVRVASRVILALGLFAGPALASDEPGRIVALTPAIAQICYEVLPERERTRVAGVAEHSRVPGGQGPAIVASALSVDQEKLVALRPALVLHSASQSLRPGLLKPGVRQEVRVESLRDIAAAYRRIGILLAHPGRGEQLAREFDSGVAALKGLLSAPASGAPGRIFFQLDGDPMIAVGGRGDFLPELLHWMGAGNVFASMKQAYPRVTREAVMARRPELIVVIGLSAERARFEEVARSWKNGSSPAAHRVLVFDGDDLTLPSLSLLAGGRRLAAAIRSDPGTSFRD
jgi:ABC-type Fe3+-hydroxamate transport system substrate-binding protein